MVDATVVSRRRTESRFLHGMRPNDSAGAPTYRAEQADSRETFTQHLEQTLKWRAGQTLWPLFHNDGLRKRHVRVIWLIQVANRFNRSSARHIASEPNFVFIIAANQYWRWIQIGPEKDSKKSSILASSVRFAQRSTCRISRSVSLRAISFLGWEKSHDLGFSHICSTPGAS